MHTAVVLRILGLLVMIFSLTLLPPLAIAVHFDEGGSEFMLAFGLTFTVGMLVWLPCYRAQADLHSRDGFIITVMFWVVLSCVGAIPFMVAEEPHLSLIDALFESVSGLTTTGATVITGLDHLPKSILYYRQQLQWLGGIGIVVIAVAIMPMLGIGGMQLYRAETPGHVKDAKLTPRITETAKILFKIYCYLTIACALAYWWAGMSLFDAVCHSFATVAIGGFSTHDASIGYFDSQAVMAVCMLFMVISGINFALHYVAFTKRSIAAYLRDSEAVFYLLIMATGVVVTIGYLAYAADYSVGDTMWHGAFQLVSIMTTAGFATANFSAWPSFLPYFLIFLSFFGACAGSTGGGIKIGRMLIVAKQSLREMYRLVHPSAVMPLKIGQRTVPERITAAVMGFFGAYLAIYYSIVLVLLATGLDYSTAWSATAASMNNLGPGLGQVSAHYGDINWVAKWVLCGAMLLGRLEIFTLLVLLSPAFWRR